MAAAGGSFRARPSPLLQPAREHGEHDSGVEPRSKVIDHDADTSAQPFQPAHGPRLDDVEDAEEHEACRDHDVWLEVNAQPDRLDLPDTYCRRARDGGVQFTFGTDAHKPDDMDFMDLAVNVARRGWLEAKDVINTLTARQLGKRLRKG